VDKERSELSKTGSGSRSLIVRGIHVSRSGTPGEISPGEMSSYEFETPES
jgi:hypothetical protein